MDYTKLANKLMRIAEHGEVSAMRDLYELARDMELVGSSEVLTSRGEYERTVFDEGNFKQAHHLARETRRLLAAELRNGRGNSDAEELYRSLMLFDAPHDFDTYCQYIEMNREPKKRFYLPRRKQLLPIVKELQRLSDGELELLGISTPPGVGKALANDTPILTRHGWKNHGDLVVGDEVIGLDGNFKKVIAVHPKCMLDCLVEFTNGENIQCHENHEWLIHDRNVYDKSLQNHIYETKRLEKRKLSGGGEVGKRGHRYAIQLPHHGYVVGERKALEVDPYLLGVWLGDGANKNPRICCAPKDKAVIDRIVGLGYSIRWQTVHKQTGVLYFDFDIRKELQKYGMCHSRKIIPKHIPSEYLTASVEQRLQLLAGLIDTDGTLSGSKYIFTTAEEPLRDSFVELISTFGWRACVCYHKPQVSSSGIFGRRGYYTISFTPDTTIPCELVRKQNKEPRKQRAISFKSITRVEPKEGNCITVEGDGMYLAGRTMLPTHNTTMALFYLSFEGGRNPDLGILSGSHSASILNGMYSELLRILDPHGEYLFNEVFPHANIAGTDAKDLKIDLAKQKRFSTFMFASRGSSLAGKVRCTNLLYCDDLVDSLETAMSKERLDKIWNNYTVDYEQRMQGQCRELIIGTRWSLYDPIGRLKDDHENDPKAKFISYPAVDENGESLWDYPYNLGFTTEFYKKRQASMDDASWRSIFMNEPIEREGQLFAPDELRRYFELPDRDPDSVIAVCDIADGGGDYWCMPVAYQYGNDFYIDYILCDNGKPNLVENRIVDALINHKVHTARFESNRAGGRIAENVQQRVKERGGITKIQTKWNQTAKDTRILVSSGFVKEHFLFKDESCYIDNKEYRIAMSFLTGYTMAGKNKHDDVPDALAQLVDFIATFSTGKVEIIKRPF